MIRRVDRLELAYTLMFVLVTFVVAHATHQHPSLFGWGVLAVCTTFAAYHLIRAIKR